MKTEIAMKAQETSAKRPSIARLREALGGQLEHGEYFISSIQGGTQRMDAWANAVSEYEEYWLYHPDYVAPSATAPNVQWRIVYIGPALAPGCAALKADICARFPARTTGVVLRGQSFDITDQGDFTCP
ncbi:MAG: hypothetical protein U1E39_17590 [Planctomycetota bacterium]